MTRQSFNSMVNKGRHSLCVPIVRQKQGPCPMYLCVPSIHHSVWPKVVGHIHFNWWINEQPSQDTPLPTPQVHFYFHSQVPLPSHFDFNFHSPIAFIIKPSLTYPTLSMSPLNASHMHKIDSLALYFILFQVAHHHCRYNIWDHQSECKYFGGKGHASSICQMFYNDWHHTGH